MAEQCPNKWNNADEKVDERAYPEFGSRSMTIEQVKEMRFYDIQEQVMCECDIEVNGSFITDKFGVQSGISDKAMEHYGHIAMIVVGSYEVAKAVAEVDPSESAGVVQYASNGFAIVV